ncbi:MAG: hypothetical protein ACLUNO_12365 [Oscillospiraceae bacterium]
MTTRVRSVAAATLYELAYNAIRGHCFISYRNLLAATSQLSGVPDELVAQSVDTLVESGELVRERVAGCDGCYLARLHEAEAYTAERLLAMAQNEYRRMPDTEKIAAQIEAQLGLTFAEQQKETLRLACQHQVIAITGRFPAPARRRLSGRSSLCLMCSSSTPSLPPRPAAPPSA